jgi:primosomal replication protein N
VTKSKPANPPQPEPEAPDANDFRLDARVAESSPLRHTPGGIPVASVVLEHESRRIEAGVMREVKVKLPAMALGELARILAAAPLGARMTATGFLAAKSAHSRVPILHLNNIEFMEGN